MCDATQQISCVGNVWRRHLPQKKTARQPAFLEVFPLQHSAASFQRSRPRSPAKNAVHPGHHHKSGNSASAFPLAFRIGHWIPLTRAAPKHSHAACPCTLGCALTPVSFGAPAGSSRLFVKNFLDTSPQRRSFPLCRPGRAHTYQNESRVANTIAAS